MNTTTVVMPAGQRQWDAVRRPFASLDAIEWGLVEAALASPEGAGRLGAALAAACGKIYPGRGCAINWTAQLTVGADSLEILTPTSGTLIRVTAAAISASMSHLPEGYDGKSYEPSTLGASRLAQMQAALFGVRS